MILLLLASAVPVQAQSAAAPPPSPETTSLYAHRSTSDSDELAGWMNTLLEDGDDTAMGPSASCGPGGQGLTGVGPVDDQLTTTAIDRTYTIALKPALAGTMTLDTTKAAKATMHFGAGSCQGKVHLASSLAAGPTVLAKAEGDLTYAKGAPYPALALDMPVTVGTVPAGEPLVWTIKVTGKTAGAGYLGVSAAQGHTVLGLPILAVEAGAAAGSSTKVDTNATFQHRWAFANATTQSHRIVWTRAPAAVMSSLGVHASAGSVSVRVVDAANATLLSRNATASSEATQSLSGKAGNWTVVVSFTAFKGNATLLLTQPGSMPTGTGTKAWTGGAGSGAGAGAGTGAGPVTGSPSSSKGTPGVPTLAVLAALGALVSARRRR